MGQVVHGVELCAFGKPLPHGHDRNDRCIANVVKIDDKRKAKRTAEALRIASNEIASIVDKGRTR